MADIRFTQSRKQIISLWSNVFKDSGEDIVFFLDNCKKYKCLGLFEDEKLASMLFLVECSYCNKDGYYVLHKSGVKIVGCAEKFMKLQNFRNFSAFF